MPVKPSVAYLPHDGPSASPRADNGGASEEQPQVVLSFDVEEHYRIEAARGLSICREQIAHYRDRLDCSTRWLLDQLASRGIRATFFIVGQIAEHNPGLIRAIHAGGHEVASHSWDHQRVHSFTAATFREDVRRSKDALEQITGEAVVGFRAPTFSIVRQTAFALDVLAESGMRYDSSIYPVRHDRYGVPDAPRWPFRAQGEAGTLLELPPATWRVLGMNLPIGGGGYFRLFPPVLMRRGIVQTMRKGQPPVVMLYFHPWEFDPEQERLPLRRLNRFRTYVGLSRTCGRLTALLERHVFQRAVDVAAALESDTRLPVVRLTS
jgi:polysaccharide deacetylase family protein (PEP-CTERM system associated)